MFTIQIQDQADIWKQLCEFYLQPQAKIIDYTYGTGATWWNIKEGTFKVTKTDAVPTAEDVIKKDITTDDYTELGLHDAGFFDPPYLVGRQSFDYHTKTLNNRQGFSGKRSWSSSGLARFVSNPETETYATRVMRLNEVAKQTIKKDGLLFIKIMDPRHEGKLITHHITNVLALSDFELIDQLIYVRQGATTWKIKNHLQNLHGYWQIFKKLDSSSPSKARFPSSVEHKSDILP